MEEKKIEKRHRHEEFCFTMKGMCEKLRSKKLGKNLLEKTAERKFWETVDLKALVQWRIAKQSLKKR